MRSGKLLQMGARSPGHVDVPACTGTVAAFQLTPEQTEGKSRFQGLEVLGDHVDGEGMSLKRGKRTGALEGRERVARPDKGNASLRFERLDGTPGPLVGPPDADDHQGIHLFLQATGKTENPVYPAIAGERLGMIPAQHPIIPLFSCKDPFQHALPLLARLRHLVRTEGGRMVDDRE